MFRWVKNISNKKWQYTDGGRINWDDGRQYWTWGELFALYCNSTVADLDTTVWEGCEEFIDTFCGVRGNATLAKEKRMDN